MTGYVTTQAIPQGGVYFLGEYKPGNRVNLTDIDGIIAGRGEPLAPDSEAIVGRWRLAARLYGYFDAQRQGEKNARGPLSHVELVEGEFDILITDKAVRGTAIKGISGPFGNFVAGLNGEQSSRRTFAFVWPYELIMALETIGTWGRAHRLQVIGPSGPGLVAHEATVLKENFTLKGFPMTNKVGAFAAQVTDALVKHALAGPDPLRAGAAREIATGKRSKPDSETTVARFGPAS